MCNKILFYKTIYNNNSSSNNYSNNNKNTVPHLYACGVTTINVASLKRCGGGGSKSYCPSSYILLNIEY